MNKKQLYDDMAARKSAPKDFGSYIGDNGRVNKCAELIKQGKLVSSKSGKLLDIGGGIGDLGCSVRDLFDETWIIDISQSNLNAAASKGNSVLNLDIDESGMSPITNNDITLVTALDFIEHIIDPENFARECFRVLKPGGQVFINTPNIEFWKHLESLVRHGIFPHTSGDREVWHGGHLAFYGFHDMKEIFTAAGFSDCEQVKDEEGYSSPPEFYLNIRNPQTQLQYKTHCMRLGNPNLLFKCEKP